MNSLVTLRRRFAGVAMVEFALLLPFMAALFLGFVEIGRALYQQNMLNKAMTTGARYVARVPGGVTPSCTPGSNWGSASNQAREIVIYPRGTDGGMLVPGLNDPGVLEFSVRAENAGGMNVCVIRAQARVPFESLAAAPLPMLNLSSVALNAAAEERFIGE